MLFTHEHAELRRTVERFCREELNPHVDAWEDAGGFPAHDVFRKLGDLGLLGLTKPAAVGGAALDYSYAVVLAEALGACNCGGVPLAIGVQTDMATPALARYGHAELQREFLAPAIAGEQVACIGVSEPGAGSDVAAIRTTARKDGGDYVLNGGKLWITNGLEAELFLVFANVDFAKGYRGITAFFVESGWKGFSKGKKEDKLGIRASSTLALAFEDLEVPEENVVGKVGEGYKIAIETLNEGRIGIGAQMLGVARAALDYSAKYVQTRVQFGKPISEFQAIQHELARMDMELECARLAVYNAARLKEAGMPFAREGAIAKLKSSEVAEYCTSKGLELLGGYGYVKDYPLEKMYRDAKIGKIYEGTSYMQLSTIAKDVLKRSA